MQRAIETLGDATGKTGWAKTYARKWTPPPQVCGAWRRKVEQTPDQIAQSALDAFGKGRQIDKCIEELGELTTALMKWKNGEAGADAVIDELADVAVTGNTLCVLFGWEAVDERVKVKLARLVRLVADQVALNAEKAKAVKSQPVPGKTLCVDCPHWHPVMDHPSECGICHHPSQPWDTAERRVKDGPYLAATNREEACLLPTPKPVKPVLRWEERDGDLFLYTPIQAGSVKPWATTAKWLANPFGCIGRTCTTQAEAKRHVELALGLGEVEIWTP